MTVWQPQPGGFNPFTQFVPGSSGVLPGYPGSGGFGFSNTNPWGNGPAQVPAGGGTGSWYTNPALVGTILSGIGSLYGAYSQNQANQQNAQAIQQRNAMMANLINPLMMQGQNPYAAAMGQMAQGFSGMGSGGGFTLPPVGAPAPTAPAQPAQPTLVPRSTRNADGQGGLGLMASPSPMVNAMADPTGTLRTWRGPWANSSGVPEWAQTPPGGGSQIPTMPPGEPAGGNTPTGPRTPPGLTPDMIWNPTQLGAAPTVEAPVIGNIPSAVASLSQLPTAGEAFNVGQDGLMQSMRRDISAVQDPNVSSSLARAVNGDTQFNNTELFAALQGLDQRALNDQVTALQGSAGSFGQRFGTAGQQAEANLRGNFTAQTRARDAQIAQQSFEAAQGRMMQGLGLGLNREQFGTQTALQNAQLQQAAAAQLAGLGVQQQQMGLQNNQFNAGAQNAMSMQNQQILAQIAQQNAANQLQAGLANQGMAGQYGLANFGAQNQAGQFNAQNAQDMYRFGIGQQLSYDQLAMQALAQANQSQMSQNQFNAGLIGMLGGLPMPNSMPSPWGGAMSDIGMLMMLYPHLRNA